MLSHPTTCTIGFIIFIRDLNLQCMRVNVSLCSQKYRQAYLDRVLGVYSLSDELGSSATIHKRAATAKTAHEKL